MTILSLVKSIARQIKYQQLDDLIDSEVIINSVDSVFEDVKRGLQLPGNAMPVPRDNKYSRIAIAKYGLIDIDFTVSSKEIVNPIEGFEAIRTLHLYHEPPKSYEFSGDDPFMDVGVGYLEDMVQELEAETAYLMLYITTDHPDGLSERKKLFKNWLIPNDYFPRKFVVEDAALCNTKLAWMTKHFYL